MMAFAMTPFLWRLYLRFSSVLLVLTSTQSIPACDSPIFCHGPLLATVQNASVFSDCKEFVDRPLVDSPDAVLQAFKGLSDHSVRSLTEFVERWTMEAGTDLDTWEPPDWTPRPGFIDAIRDEKLREWALDINAMWMQLGKRVKNSVAGFPERHSLIHLPNPFIVPGGRFRETYYWDTYWIVEGLLLCGMNDTARGMILNLAYLVEQYGLVPNGGRQYYIRRSQPPLLTQMVELYYNRTGDGSLFSRTLPLLVVEYEFWMENRTISSRGPVYRAPTDTPRPESYREDIATAENLPPGDRAALYSNLASGAESGWDFSSRWLAHSGPGANQLYSISTAETVAVDLSAILCANEASLARLFNATGDEDEVAYFRERVSERRAGFDRLFWNESLGIWRDAVLGSAQRDNTLNGSFYASSFAPLVWRCSQGGLEQDEKFLSTLESLRVLDYPGGVPTSVWRNSSQQWDFPNAWAPLQWMLVEAWHDSPRARLKAAAKKVARTWLTTTYLAWERNNHTMFEKYNCTQAGQPGGGGEYDIQVGFGWTNGVVLRLLSLYPDISISSSSSSSGHSEQNLGWVSVIVLALVTVAVSIPCLLWCRRLYVTGRDRYWGRVRNEHLVAAQGGLSHSRTHSRPHSPITTDTMFTNRYAADVNGSNDMIYNETLLEFDV